MLVREAVTGQLWSSVNCSWGNISIRFPINLCLLVVCWPKVFLIKLERLISFTNAFIYESLNEMKYLFQIEKKSKDSLGFLFWFCLILFSFIGIKIVNWMLFLALTQIMTLCVSYLWLTFMHWEHQSMPSWSGCSKNGR